MAAPAIPNTSTLRSCLYPRLIATRDRSLALVKPLTAEDMVVQPMDAASQDNEQLLQMYGSVWQWTQSAYAPYPWYTPPPGAIGEYNGKFMVSQLCCEEHRASRHPATPVRHIAISSTLSSAGSSPVCV